MTIFNNEAIGKNHENGAIRLPESVNLLPVSDQALSLYKKCLQTSDDRIYGKAFGKINGSEAAWARKLGMSHTDLRVALDELIQAGLIETRSEGIFVANYRVFVQGCKADRDEFLSQVKV